MLLWVGSDLLVTIMVKVFASEPGSIGDITLLSLVVIYGAGTVFIAKKYK